MSSKKVDRYGQAPPSQGLRDSCIPALSELVARAKQNAMTKEQLISALEQLTVDVEKNSFSDSKRLVRRDIVLNSIEWWRTDLFIKLLNHDTLQEYIGFLGGTNAVIFLFERSTARFHLERGEHIPEQWRVASLHTRGYPQHKIDDWKQEPVNANDRTNRLQHTGYRLYLRNLRLLSELDLLLEKVKEYQDEKKLIPEQLSQSPDFFALRAAFRLGHFRNFNILIAPSSDVRNDLQQLVDRLEVTALSASRFSTFIHLLSRLRLDPSFTSLFATWRSSNLNAYRYITTYELSILFLYYECWHLLADSSQSGKRRKASDPKQLASELAKHLEGEQEKYQNDKENDFSLKTYLERSLLKLVTTDSPHPVSTEDIMDALRMSLLFIPSLEEYAKNVYEELLEECGVSACEEAIQERIIELAQPILNDLEEIYKKYSLVINSKESPQKAYNKLLELVTTTIAKGLSDKAFLFSEAALEAFEGFMPLKMKTVLNTGGVVDRLVMPIVLAEDLYGLLVMDINPQTQEPNKEAIENLLSKLALSITLYDKVKLQAEQSVRDVFIRVLRHELRNFGEVINALPDYGFDAQDISKEISERRKPMELTLKCYSLIWTKEKFEEISSIDLCQSIKYAFNWCDYTVRIHNAAPQIMLSEVLKAVVTELLRNSYNRGKSEPPSSDLFVFEKDGFKYVTVKNEGRISENMLKYLNNRDFTSSPEEDFGSWSCVWLVQNYLKQGQIRWISSDVEVEVEIKFV